MPSFLGAFLAALGAAEPFGVKHHAARPPFGRPVDVPNVAENYYRLLSRASSAWRAGLGARRCPAFGRQRGGSQPRAPRGGKPTAFLPSRSGCSTPYISPTPDLLPTPFFRAYILPFKITFAGLGDGVCGRRWSVSVVGARTKREREEPTLELACF